VLAFQVHLEGLGELIHEVSLVATRNGASLRRPACVVLLYVVEQRTAFGEHLARGAVGLRACLRLEIVLFAFVILEVGLLRESFSAVRLVTGKRTTSQVVGRCKGAGLQVDLEMKRCSNFKLTAKLFVRALQLG
jgi:hypothetical protein